MLDVVRLVLGFNSSETEKVTKLKCIISVLSELLW